MHAVVYESVQIVGVSSASWRYVGLPDADPLPNLETGPLFSLKQGDPSLQQEDSQLSRCYYSSCCCHIKLYDSSLRGSCTVVRMAGRHTYLLVAEEYEVHPLATGASPNLPEPAAALHMCGI